MNRDTEVSETSPVLGPNSVASRINWVLTSSHSTGTAVRSLRNHRAVGHRRPVAVPVGRRELDVARRDQILGDDHGLGVGRHGHVAVDLQDHLGLGALGFDRVDGADLDAGHPHLVAGVDRRGRGEVRGDGLRAEEHLAHQERRSGDQQRRPAATAVDGRRGAYGLPSSGRSPGCGIPLTGNGSSARGPALSGGWPALTPRRNPNA